MNTRLNTYTLVQTGPVQENGMTQLDSYSRAPRQQTAMATAPGSQFSGHFSAQFDRQSAGFSASHSAVGSPGQSSGQFDSCAVMHSASSNMSVIDWDLLFKAALMRLCTCVSNGPAPSVSQHLQSGPTSMHETVLECAADLHRLHLDLLQQRLTR